MAEINVLAIGVNGDRESVSALKIDPVLGRLTVSGSGSALISMPGYLFRNTTLATNAGGLWIIHHSGGLGGGLIIDSNEAVAGDFSTVARGVIFGRFTANTVLQNTLIVNPSTTTPGLRIQSNGILQLNGIGRQAFNIGIGFGAAGAVSNMALYQMQPVDGSGNIINAADDFGMSFTYGLGTETGGVENTYIQSLSWIGVVARTSRVNWGFGSSLTTQFVWTSDGQFTIGGTTLPTETLDIRGNLITTGVLKVPNATAANPFLALSGEINTGLFSAGTGMISVTLLGSHVLDISVFGGVIFQGIDRGVVLQATTTTAGAGGDILLQASDAVGAGPSIGGNIRLEVGNGIGGGVLGVVVFRNNSDTTTPNLVPRATGEGSLGTAALEWGDLRVVTATLSGKLTVAKAIDGVFTGLLIENSQPNVGGSTNETAEIRFGFGGNDDVARISVTKKSDYSIVANEDSALRFWVDINGTATQIVSVLNSGISLGVPASKFDFNGTAGGGGQGIRYKDVGGSLRNVLAFPGSDVVVLSNQAANGIVEIRANTSTAGSGGEVTVATFTDTAIQFESLQFILKDVNLSLGSGTTNNWNPGDVQYVRVSQTGSVTLTGIVGGTNGRILILTGRSGQTIILANENTGSTDTNRIQTTTGSDLTLSGAGGWAVWLIYDAARWMVIRGQ